MTRVIWLCGPSGIGKSSVGYELFHQLSASGVPTAFVDLDQLRLCHLGSAEDPGKSPIRAHNLAAVYEGFVAAGAACVVVSGLAHDPGRVREHIDLLRGAELTICRLRASDDDLRRRFTGRGSYLHLLDETLRSADELDRSAFADLVVDTTGLSAVEVASRVRAVSFSGVTRYRKARLRSASRPLSKGPVLLLCGPPAVGQSTVGYEVFTRIVGEGIRAAYVDLSQISYFRPAPADDPGNHRLASANLARMWAQFEAAGAQCLVAGGNVTTSDELGLYRFATVTVCRLRASPETLHGRVFRRGLGHGWSSHGDDLRGRPEPELRERAAASVAIADELERSGIGDFCVGTDGLDPAEIAARVRASAGGWPPRGVQ